MVENDISSHTPQLQECRSALHAMEAVLLLFSGSERWRGIIEMIARWQQRAATAALPETIKVTTTTAPPPPETIKVTTTLAAGMECAMIGLQKRQDLNGQQCECINWVEDKGRWLVGVTSSNEQVLLQPKNLAAVTGEITRPSLANIGDECLAERRRVPEGRSAPPPPPGRPPGHIGQQPGESSGLQQPAAKTTVKGAFENRLSDVLSRALHADQDECTHTENQPPQMQAQQQAPQMQALQQQSKLKVREERSGEMLADVLSQAWSGDSEPSTVACRVQKRHSVKGRAARQRGNKRGIYRVTHIVKYHTSHESIDRVRCTQRDTQ